MQLLLPTSAALLLRLRLLALLTATAGPALAPAVCHLMCSRRRRGFTARTRGVGSRDEFTGGREFAGDGV